MISGPRFLRFPWYPCLVASVYRRTHLTRGPVRATVLHTSCPMPLVKVGWVRCEEGVWLVSIPSTVYVWNPSRTRLESFRCQGNGMLGRSQIHSLVGQTDQFIWESHCSVLPSTNLEASPYQRQLSWCESRMIFSNSSGRLSLVGSCWRHDIGLCWKSENGSLIWQNQFCRAAHSQYRFIRMAAQFPTLNSRGYDAKFCQYISPLWKARSRGTRIKNTCESLPSG